MDERKIKELIVDAIRRSKVRDKRNRNDGPNNSSQGVVGNIDGGRASEIFIPEETIDGGTSDNGE
jgi:hypothetical protein